MKTLCPDRWPDRTATFWYPAAAGMRAAAALLLLGVLSACGVDGEPIPPGGAGESGATIGGEAQIGVVGTL